jgi:hypothetical protein
VVSGQSTTTTGIEQFFGAWRYVGAIIDGKPRLGRGPNPKGIIAIWERIR